MMNFGNLAVSQAVLHALARQHEEGRRHRSGPPPTCSRPRSCVGTPPCSRGLSREATLPCMSRAWTSTSASSSGGQIGGERCRLFQVYAAGNFIEAGWECPYFQIGESQVRQAHPGPRAAAPTRRWTKPPSAR